MKSAGQAEASLLDLVDVQTREQEFGLAWLAKLNQLSGVTVPSTWDRALDA